MFSNESVRRLLLAVVATTLLHVANGARADSVTSAQRDAASQYFAAVASGDAQAIAFAIHPDELIKLRTRLLTLLREEARHDDGTLRGRLFGSAMQLADVERLTENSFFVTLSRRLVVRGREFQDVRWIGSMSEGSSLLWVVGRLKPIKDRGSTEVVQLVGLMPYGKDWKAIVPTEIQAQIEDLIAGRGPAAAVRADAAPTGTPRANATAGVPGSGTVQAVTRAANQGVAPKAMLTLLDSAEQVLIGGKCDVYYREYLSPDFRRMTPPKGLDTLIRSCSNSLGMRETLIATLRIVRGLTPQLELEGSRAAYDVSNQGLPYDRFVLERLQGRWYIAE